MIWAVLMLVSFTSVYSFFAEESHLRGCRQDRSAEIAELLKQLAPGEIEESPGVVILGPTEEITEKVRRRLAVIANESAESRASVIRALTNVLNTPDEDRDIARTTRWNVAVSLLGELKATEAIRDLVRNLNRTGEAVLTRPRIRPVEKALIRIGEPAIPILVEALSQPDLRREATSTLGEIGQPALNRLLDALSHGSPPVRGGAALALSRIGGANARDAIQRALRAETNEEVKKELEEALRYMRPVEK